MVKQIYTLSMQLLLVLGKDKYVVCVNEIIFQERFFNLALLSILECLIPHHSHFSPRKGATGLQGGNEILCLLKITSSVNLDDKVCTNFDY